MPKCVYFYKYVFILSNMYAFIFYKKNYVFTNMFVWFDQYVLIFTNSLFFLKYVKSFTNIVLMFTNLCVFLCSRVCNTRGPILKISSGTKQGPEVKHENEAVLHHSKYATCAHIFSLIHIYI